MERILSGAVMVRQLAEKLASEVATPIEPSLVLTTDDLAAETVTLITKLESRLLEIQRALKSKPAPDPGV